MSSTRSLLFLRPEASHLSSRGASSYCCCCCGIEQGRRTGSRYKCPVLHTWSACQQVILATALIELQNDKGESTIARALLDQGSEFSFITEEIAQCLSLKKTDVNVSVLGIGSATQGIGRHKIKIFLPARILRSHQSSGNA